MIIKKDAQMEVSINQNYIISGFGLVIIQDVDTYQVLLKPESGDEFWISKAMLRELIEMV